MSTFFLSYSHSREEPINKRKQVVERLFLACLSGSHLSLGQWNFTDRNHLAVNSYLLFTFFTIVTKPMRPIQGVTKRFVTQRSCKNNNKHTIHCLEASSRLQAVGKERNETNQN
jgi:hypothetical protein